MQTKLLTASCPASVDDAGVSVRDEIHGSCSVGTLSRVLGELHRIRPHSLIHIHNRNLLANLQTCLRNRTEANEIER